MAVACVLAVGVSSYVGMAGVYQDLNLAKTNYYRNYHLTHFILDIKRAPETAVQQLQNISNVSRLRDRIKTQTMVTLPANSYQTGIKMPIPGEILSLPVPKRDIINDIMLYKGKWFSDPYAHEVILDEQFAEAHHLKPGDRITVRLPDKEYKVLIVGTAYSPEYVLLIPPGSVISPEPSRFAAMYMPRKFLQQATNLNSAFNQLLGQVRDDSAIALSNTMTLLSNKLDHYGVQLQTARQDYVPVKVLHDELEGVKSISKFFPSLFLLVGILVLNVMLNRLVAQQRSIIGTLKAIGYGNAEIVWHYICYGIIIGCVGGILGILLGIWLEHGMLVMYKTYFVIPEMRVFIHPQIYCIGLAISVFSSMMGSLTGSYKAMKLDPAEAMRPPAPEKGAHIILESFSRFWLCLSFRSKMIARAIFRNRFRGLVTITASIVATALVFSSLSFLDAMDKMIDFSFEKMQHQDFNLTLRDPLGMHVMQTANIISGVKKVESQLNVPAELKNGPYHKRMNIVGLPENNKLFTPLDQKDEPIKVEKSGLVLTKTLADMLKVKTGDVILLRPLLGKREVIRVKIKNVIASYLGFAAYADQTWLSHLLGDSWVTSNILFQLYPQASEKTFIAAISQFKPMVNLSDRKKSKQLFFETMNQFMTFSMLLMIGFAGIIAIGSVVNTAMISLNERERDVASLRVLGYSNFQVGQIFFGESAVLNIVGILLGLLLGIYFTYAMSAAYSTEMFRIPIVIRPLRLFESACIMVVFVIISQSIIFRIITKMHWFDILNVRE